MNYNDKTKGAKLTVKLIERDDRDDKSVWEITTTEDVLVDEANGRILKAGASFNYDGEYDDQEDDVLGYIEARGLLDACNISAGDFEGYLSDEAETVEIDKLELEELRKKAAKWDHYIEGRAEHLNNVSPEERRARAKKAVAARWAKRNNN